MVAFGAALQRMDMLFCCETFKPAAVMGRLTVCSVGH